MKLHSIAHSRAGDKGSDSTLSLIAYNKADYSRLCDYVTAERVKSFFGDIIKGEVTRYEVPQLSALNFVLRESLKGGVTRSLAMDLHGKSFSNALLNMDIPD